MGSNPIITKNDMMIWSDNTNNLPTTIVLTKCVMRHRWDLNRIWDKSTTCIVEGMVVPFFHWLNPNMRISGSTLEVID